MSGLVATLGVLAGCATAYGDADPPVPSPAAEGRDKSETSGTSEPDAKSVTSELAKNTPSPSPDSAAKPAAAPTKTTVAAPPASIAFSWNRVSATAEYSLDVILEDRTTIGPCIGVTWIHRKLSTTFRGNCPSSDAHPTVAMDQIDGFQLCWAENDDWKNAECTHVVWDGSSSTVTFDN